MNDIQKEKLKKRFLIGSVGIAILFMAFGSYGSFNPFEVGFYTLSFTYSIFGFLDYFFNSDPS